MLPEKVNLRLVLSRDRGRQLGERHVRRVDRPAFRGQAPLSVGLSHGSHEYVRHPESP